MHAWATEAAQRSPWLHGYWQYDFSDRYYSLAGVSVGATAAGVRVGSPGTPTDVSKLDARFYALNLLSELDSAGEYYIERSNQSQVARAHAGMLYFRRPDKPPAGQSHGDEKAFLSMAPSVISITDGTSFVQFLGLRLEHSRGTAVRCNATVQTSWGTKVCSVRNISISGCTVANTGGAGIELHDCSGCVIEGSEIYGVADLALSIAGGHHRTLTRSDNMIRDNSFHHYARWTRTYQPGIFFAGVTHPSFFCKFATHSYHV